MQRTEESRVGGDTRKHASVAAQPKSPRRNALTSVAAEACFTSQSLIVVEAATAVIIKRRRRIVSAPLLGTAAPRVAQRSAIRVATGGAERG